MLARHLNVGTKLVSDWERGAKRPSGVRLVAINRNAWSQSIGISGRNQPVRAVWEDDGLLVTLTIAGDANKVATVLQQIPAVVDPTQPPSEWIEPGSSARCRSA